MNSSNTNYFLGIEHLTIDAERYIYYKGHNVENYSYDLSDTHEREQALNEALELVSKCRHVESLDLIPNSSNTCWRWEHIKDFHKPYDPYLGFFLNLYNVFNNPSGKLAAAVYVGGNLCIFELVKEYWKITHQDEEPFKLYHKLKTLGYTTADLGQARNANCPDGYETAAKASTRDIIRYLKSENFPPYMIPN